MTESLSSKESPPTSASGMWASAHELDRASHPSSASAQHLGPGIFSAEPAAMSSYYSPHDMGPLSPNEGISRLGENLRPSSGAQSTPSPSQISAVMMHNPKRAYRQRRKDPSCDACRERKVKCDATETASCTECSSRNVRCQFTKDTNRRMSSIKQVQDLERQLLEARQQLERYHAVERKPDLSADGRPNTASSVYAEFPSIGKSPRRMLKARAPQDLTSARVQLNDVGRGLLKPPVTGVQLPSHTTHIRVSDLQGLPARPAAERLLHYYHEYIHRLFPVLYWPKFQRNFAIAMEQGSAQSLATDWVATLYAVLACGALATHDRGRLPEAQEYLTRAISTINFWEDDVSTNQAIVAFLASIALIEMNRKSASWIWLGSAIRIVQDLGLHVQGGQWSPVEGEMRKRIWYSFYVWDRLLALELGKPMLINDDECDTEYPQVLDEERLMADDLHTPFPPTLLLANIHIARLMAPLAKTFRSLCITSEALTKFETHLGECLHLFPRPLQLSSTAGLDPCIMAPLISFQNTRLLLHRHNLSPSCSPEQRAHAIEQCLHASRDTASALSRCMLPHVQAHDWEQRFVLAASTMLCTHLWRCMLFLLFRQVWDAFFLLLRAASTIDDARSINICCGRHLSFFLRCLVERVEKASSIDIDQDEELLVYLSADLQASTNSWVWGSAETGTHLSRRQKHGRPRNTHNEHEAQGSSGAKSPSWDNMLSEEEKHDWGGWQHIENSARYLQQLTERQRYPHNHIAQQPLPRSPLSNGPAAGVSGPRLAPITIPNEPPDTNRARMTIANII
ncbi:C6 transcription factor [Cladophialophora carrionii]|uniref:C6 transcription factor n=1 Tax=Cladophialophora carrionii TaxID=86049 RepID=A0A1C1CQU6_9EURO|nr:C6 transcription factor [Cladophialophora carrionii]